MTILDSHQYPEYRPDPDGHVVVEVSFDGFASTLKCACGAVAMKRGQVTSAEFNHLLSTTTHNPFVQAAGEDVVTVKSPPIPDDEGPQQSIEGMRAELEERGMLPAGNMCAMGPDPRPTILEPLLDEYENMVRRLQDTIREQRAMIDTLHRCVDEQHRSLIRRLRLVAWLRDGPLAETQSVLADEVIAYGLS